MRVWLGQPYPLGATWTGLGVNFAIYSAHATRVDLCLFDSPAAGRPTACVPLPEHSDMVVSFNQKHNEANRDGNSDGDDHNLSWNCGAEGPADDPAVLRLREQQKRNLLASLLLSVGVRMISGGDELGRTQRANNNAYCQDNELAWIDWELDKDQQQLLEFVSRLMQLRKKHPIFRRRHFFQGRDIVGAGVKDVTWLSPTGLEMTDLEWHQSFARCLGLFLAGDAIDEYDDRGAKISDDNFILLFNSHHEEIDFTLPPHPPLARWEVLVDTSHASGDGAQGRLHHANEKFPLQRRSMVVLKQLISPRFQR